ncbi:MAG: IPT/TIG domain-containing protein [Alphaproteobacteria bacterium]|nr:IPT/TIG domain-containing protein [Alphaproteobacteria bacterium]
MRFLPRTAILIALTLAACNNSNRELYYTGDGPAISGFEGESTELGNLGGADVTITGSGFGTDPTQVVVQFGSQNAEIVDVSDGAIHVITPVGPIEGGAVDVKIATSTGQTIQDDFYTYDVGEVYAGQYSYVLVNNYWHSCFGGRDDLGVDQGCENVSYVGNVGIDGAAEVFNFEYARKHTRSYGWWGGADWTAGDWRVEIPSYAPFAQAVDDLRQTIPNFKLHNSVLDDRGWCADLNALGSWYFGGTDELDAYSYSSDGTLNESLGASNEADCEAIADARWYDLSYLPFCEVPEFEENHSNDYQADWPVGHPFFVPAGESDALDDPVFWLNSCRDGNDNDGNGLTDGQDPACHPTVSFSSPETGLEGVTLTLPEPVRFQATQGINVPAGLDDIWPLLSMTACFDDDGDGNSDLDEVAIRLEWEPSGFTPSEGGKIKAHQTHVRVSLNVLTLGWFGGEAQPFRASITVPDQHDVDTSTGLSKVDIPVEILYQVPEIGFPNGIGSCSNDLGGLVCTFADPLETGWGYLIITADRVTEYRIGGDDGDWNLAGDVVFAYATGDFGFQDWEHPLNMGDCADCLDNDGDGWPDELDADCIEGAGAEDGSFDGTGTFTCSDGQDNDGDGVIDADDDDCEDGTGRETNCGDGVDNDSDGWTDDEDGECFDPNGIEEGLDDPAWGCTGGLDEDGDGWIDADDPDCVTGADDELGYGTTACNDGVDNDGHFDADADDPYCQERGASADTEVPTAYTSECIDGEDNENTDDLFIDLFDPDCDSPPHWREDTRFYNPSNIPWAPACYNGLDDDGDGLADAEDPGCWVVNPDQGWAYIPDGFLRDEAADTTWPDQSCFDGVDNDGDGGVDFDDVDDCFAGFYDPNDADGNSVIFEPGDMDE